MADLPSIPLQTPQVRAPSSPVSPGDIAAPYASLARTLDQMGEQISENIAKPFAEQAGREAVTMGPDGQPVIAKMPIFGEASQVYTRAARMTALAQEQPKLDSELTKIRLKYPNDPEGYRNAASAFLKQHLANQPDPAVRAALEKSGLDTAEQNYRSTLVQFDNTNRTNALESLKARLAAINEKGASLARQGGTGTEEYERLHQDRAALYGELTADPRFHFPKERADQELKANRDADFVEAAVGWVQRQYVSKKNLPEAQRALHDIFWGPGSENLNLTPAQRNHGITEGLKSLERTTVEDKVATTAFRTAVTEYGTTLRNAPETFNDSRHNDMVTRARELGDYQSIMQLDAIRIFNPTFAAIKSLPPAEQQRIMGDWARGVVPALPVRLSDKNIQSQIETEAERMGVSPQLAVAVVAIESGGNPGAVSPSGQHRGLFQLSSDEFAKGGGVGDVHDISQNIRAGIASIKAKSEMFQKEFGRAPNATEVYLMHQQGEAGLRAHLANPDQPAWVSMLGTGEGKKKGEAWAKAAIWGNLPPSAREKFGSVENVSSRDFVGVWAQKVQGVPYEGTGLVPGQSAYSVRNPYIYKLVEDTVKESRVRAAHNATQMADDIVQRANRGDAIPDDLVRSFVISATSGGKQELIDEKVRPALMQAEKRSLARTAGPGAIAALNSQLTAQRAQGISDPITYKAVTHAQEGLEKDAELWKKSPLSIGVATKLVEPVHPITTDPAQASAELGQRDAKLKVLQGSGRGVGPASVLLENEGEGLKTTLVQGDPAAAGALLSGMAATLSPENLKATMASEPMREALSGMIRSRDPARMTAGFAMLDKLWSMDPWGFRATYGGATTDHLQAWQGLRDSFTAPEIAERLNRADDPSVVKAREELREIAKKELTGWFGQNPGDVAYQLGSAWGVTNWIPGSGFVQRNITGSTGNVSFDPVQQHELMNDFNATYTALRSFGVDPDKAKELAAKRLKSEWGVSAASGNQLMKYPPEAYYKPVDGSHVWLSDDLRDAVTRIKGPQVTMYNEGTDQAYGRTNWTIKGLVADPQTQSEIAAGKPPSYMVAIDTGTGMTEFLSNPATGQRRWAFDRAAHVAEAEKRFERKAAATKDAMRAFDATGFAVLP